jgi:hypothetical protein
MPVPPPTRIASIVARHAVVTLAALTAAGAGCAATPAQAPTSPAPQPAASIEAPPQASAAGSPAGSPIAPPGPGEWVTWSHERKLAYMKTTFMEEERKVFASYEPVRFRDMSCRTCHGVGVTEGTFRLPNPDLPVVAPGPEGFKELASQEPEVLAFMQKRVVPETARLLGVPAFDFETHRGFSCYQCHVRGQ